MGVWLALHQGVGPAGPPGPCSRQASHGNRPHRPCAVWCGMGPLGLGPEPARRLAPAPLSFVRRPLAFPFAVGGLGVGWLWWPTPHWHIGPLVAAAGAQASAAAWGALGGRCSPGCPWSATGVAREDPRAKHTAHTPACAAIYSYVYVRTGQPRATLVVRMRIGPHPRPSCSRRRRPLLLFGPPQA